MAFLGNHLEKMGENKNICFIESQHKVYIHTVSQGAKKRWDSSFYVVSELGFCGTDGIYREESYNKVISTF